MIYLVLVGLAGAAYYFWKISHGEKLITQTTPAGGKRTLYQMPDGWGEWRTTIPTKVGIEMQFCERFNAHKSTQFRLLSGGYILWESPTYGAEAAANWRARWDKSFNMPPEEVLASVQHPDDARKLLAGEPVNPEHISAP
jgi:hypothetical protein